MIELNPENEPGKPGEAGAAAAAEASRRQLRKYASDIQRYVNRSQNQALLKRLQTDLATPDEPPTLRLVD